VFVKPHAVTDAVKETVEKKFGEVGINVLRQVRSLARRTLVPHHLTLSTLVPQLA